MKHLHISGMLFFLVFRAICIHAQDTQSVLSSYKEYDFKSGEHILFDDPLNTESMHQKPHLWIIESGNARIEEKDSAFAISITEYYTRLTPLLKSLKNLPTDFTIEYDTWLADGYDGNPGIEVHLTDHSEEEVVITPNKHDLSVRYPQNGRASKDNPESYFGENKFYNRWVHISISYNQKRLLVYLDQYKQMDIPDCGMIPCKILFTGNCSEEMPILLKNVRITSGIPKPGIQLNKGKFITHAIQFDVNKSSIKPESMAILTELANYLKLHPALRFQIGGYTDSDGNDAFNLELSQKRADAVLQQLVQMGISSERLNARGFGENNPISGNNTPEGKAMNRRVEFTQIQ